MFLLFYIINNVLQNFAQIVGIHNPENEAGVNFDSKGLPVNIRVLEILDFKTWAHN